MSPEITVENGSVIDVVFSDSEMVQFFGQPFMEIMKNNKILVPEENNGYVGRGERKFYHKKQIAKALHAYLYYKTASVGRGIGKHVSMGEILSRVHGIIPRTDYNSMKTQEWWQHLEGKFQKHLGPSKAKVNLESIVSPFVIDTIR